jgi:ureidoglycolate hydrolase
VRRKAELISVMAEQMAKEPLEMNTGSGSFTPLSSTRSLCVVDHLPPTEDIQTPITFRSEVEQLIGYELIKALSNFK